MSRPEDLIELLESSGPPPDSSRLRDLGELEAQLGYQFRHKVLLDVALTHASLSGKPGAGEFDYERLEFLGDSLLGYFAGEYLFLSHPRRTEGELTRLRSFLVSRKPLARLSKSLGLGNALRLDASARRAGVARNASILAALFESVTAAIYLDGGIEEARRFVFRCYEPLIRDIEEAQFQFKDHKSRLQEWCHANLSITPSYRVLTSTGPAHNRVFEVGVFLREEQAGVGTGRTKREAEQEAAREALEARQSSSPENP